MGLDSSSPLAHAMNFRLFDEQVFFHSGKTQDSRNRNNALASHPAKNYVGFHRI
jgi:hypothetical protein